MGTGGRPLLVVVGKPSDPQYKVPELGGYRTRAGAPGDASADNVPVVSDRSPLGPGQARCVGRALQLRADCWADGELCVACQRDGTRVLPRGRDHLASWV